MLYDTFSIPKKNGGKREISSPHDTLNGIQHKLKCILDEIYVSHKAAYGFVAGKNIVQAAQYHHKKRYVLNIDLKNFFPSISFIRVAGLFVSEPFNLPDESAKLLAEICCWKGGLPQGAPTSPVITNIICYKIDHQLLALAIKNKCNYTRYADDITFSTTRSSFPLNIACYDKSTFVVILSDTLQKIIKDNGFTINEEKVRMQDKYKRQEVTGLTVNKFPNVQRKYVRNIRAILHAWEKYGYQRANVEYYREYKKTSRHPSKESRHFNEVVNGKLDFLKMVRGANNSIYIQYRKKFEDLCKRDDVEAPKYQYHLWKKNEKSLSIQAPLLFQPI